MGCQSPNLDHLFGAKFGSATLLATGSSTVPIPVSGIFFGGTPDEVGKMVVGWISIKMSAFHANRSLADEGDKDQVMNRGNDFAIVDPE